MFIRYAGDVFVTDDDASSRSWCPATTSGVVRPSRASSLGSRYYWRVPSSMVLRSARSALCSRDLTVPDGMPSFAATSAFFAPRR